MNAAGLLFIGGMPGGMELGIILLLVILLFGADKLPKLARSSGEAMGEFRKGREEIEREIRDSARSVEELDEEEFRESEARVALDEEEIDLGHESEEETEGERVTGI